MVSLGDGGQSTSATMSLRVQHQSSQINTSSKADKHSPLIADNLVHTSTSPKVADPLGIPLEPRRQPALDAYESKSGQASDKENAQLPVMDCPTGVLATSCIGNDPVDQEHASNLEAAELARSPPRNRSSNGDSEKHNAQPAVMHSGTGNGNNLNNVDDSKNSNAPESIKLPPRDQTPRKKRGRDGTDVDGIHSGDDLGLDQDYEDKAPPSKKAATPKTKAACKAKPAPKKRAAAKKPARPPPPPSSRPSRTRKAPDRFVESSEIKPIKSAKKTTAKDSASRVFDPVYITTNSTSRLAKADVFHMLLEPTAWTCLSTEQQITLMSMLPQDTTNTARIDFIRATDGLDNLADTRPYAFTINNDCFRTDVAKFQTDLRNGHLSKTWQAAAEQAVTDRAAGVYDAFKAEEFERWWGQKSEPKS